MAKAKGKRKGRRRNKGQATSNSVSKPRLDKELYSRELERLQVELVKMQEWVRHKRLKIVVVFEGRDAAGKGGIIKRIMDRVSPRVFRVVALPAPSDREKTQFYFQRYINQLPAAGEVVLFDRSWYNRAGVERVMGFCTEEEYYDFLRICPSFEEWIIRSGIILVKYWLTVSSEEQKRRFHQRLKDHRKVWKLSPMDLESRHRWYEYSRARDIMFKATDSQWSPWYIVKSDDKRKARLNCIAHLLSLIPYEEIPRKPVKLPKRSLKMEYDDVVSMEDRRFVPEVY